MNMNNHHEVFDASLKILNQGKGYIVNEQSNETYHLKRNNLNGALNGDRVKVSVSYKSLWNYPSVKVVKVIRRDSNKFYAKLYRNKKQILASLYPFQSRKIIIKNIKNDVVDGDIFQIKIIDWRENHTSAYAEIIKLKFNSNHPKSDYFFCVNRYGINKFNYKNLSSSLCYNYKNILNENIKKRIDLSHLQTFSIDPVDAKDFDDAISIIRDGSCTELYVHIADVSVFIQENDSIDLSAQKRGNSYYFDEKTTHMIPKFLSTNICSLVPNKKRLAFTIKIVLDENVKIKEYRFIETVIINQRKFTYDEVEKIIKGIKKDEFQNSIEILKEVAEKLKFKRLKKDGFELSSNEIILKYDKNSDKENDFKIRSFKSRMMVEECMLLANKLAAIKVNSIDKDLNQYGLFRNHEMPSIKSEMYLEGLMNLEKNNHGSSYSNIKAKEINKFLNCFEEEKRIILSSLIVRKMQKANYSTKRLGHYGLGFSEYTHFTSPIRRYADLIVHRIIKGTFKNDKTIFEIIQNCNEGELRSQNAERDYNTLRGLKVLGNKKTQTLTGYIIKIQRSRIIVNENTTGVDGIILKNSLPLEEYDFDDNMLIMFSKSGLIDFKVGQKILVKIERIDLIRQQLFFSPVL